MLTMLAAILLGQWRSGDSSSAQSLRWMTFRPRLSTGLKQLLHRPMRSCKIFEIAAWPSICCQLGCKSQARSATTSVDGAGLCNKLSAARQSPIVCR